MKCKKCGNHLFQIIEKQSCINCEYNGAFDEAVNDYIYDEDSIQRKGLKRTQTTDAGECFIDVCWDEGCFIFRCSECGAVDNLAAFFD